MRLSIKVAEENCREEEGVPAMVDSSHEGMAVAGAELLFDSAAGGEDEAR